MEKAELRGILLREREKTGENSENLQEMYNELFGMREFIFARKILCYVSKRHEIDTTPIIEKAFSMNKLVAVPKIISCGQMKFYFIESLSSLKPGSFGIYEPCVSAGTNACENFGDSLCIVPALACDENRFRIGYGGGYYDRFLANYNGKSVALCRFTAEFQHGSHDIPTDYVIKAHGRQLNFGKQI